MASVKALAPLSTSSLSRRERAGVRGGSIKAGQGLQVLRVSNDDVLKETETVLFAILRPAGKEVV